ncbi:MAG: hypothetical protein U0840_16840 [Gemmataceae bacterium]
MSNRIQSLTIQPHSLVPAEAELRLIVVPDHVNTGTAIRGRLVGPQCRFATTVEVAYPFRPLLVPTGTDALTVRAIIPEASLWEPECPHLYTAVVELWQDGQLAETVTVRCGLRSLVLGPRGLRLNGRVLWLEGRAVERLDEAEALGMRQSGHNLVIAPVDAASEPLWTLADEIGLLVLGRVNSPDDLPHLPGLGRHPAALGWIGPPGLEIPPRLAGGGLIVTEGAVAQADITLTSGQLCTPHGVLGSVRE